MIEKKSSNVTNFVQFNSAAKSLSNIFKFAFVVLNCIPDLPTVSKKTGPADFYIKSKLVKQFLSNFQNLRLTHGTKCVVNPNELL